MQKKIKKEFLEKIEYALYFMQMKIRQIQNCIAIPDIKIILSLYLLLKHM